MTTSPHDQVVADSLAAMPYMTMTGLRRLYYNEFDKLWYDLCRVPRNMTVQVTMAITPHSTKPMQVTEYCDEHGVVLRRDVLHPKPRYVYYYVNVQRITETIAADTISGVHPSQQVLPLD